MRVPLILAVATVGLSVPCWAQPAQTSCPDAPSTTAATAPDPNSHASGTSPGTAGSTGWTGGTGGSYIATTPKGPTPNSPSDHPATASGVDPMKNAGTTGSAGSPPDCTPAR